MDLIKEINEKYQALEAEIDKKLEKVQAEEQKLERQQERIAEKSTAVQSPKVLSYEEALQRNANTLKSLEIAKARLRSRSTYSPVEKLLQRALENYKRELESLNKQSREDFKQDEKGEDNLIMQSVLDANCIRKKTGESHRN
ncbi:golgin subfamily A member 6-like protein 22 [Drosophila innubila]|uniref:golgin subfamily A member 6-like protein 22 n=1 Tax=Drosophila innubila TaxID=198719 RepID=UPI00148CB85D|nr:golgin subfamily A member 6-like protein 22 [Drosophila innubila]